MARGIVDRVARVSWDGKIGRWAERATRSIHRTACMDDAYPLTGRKAMRDPGRRPSPDPAHQIWSVRAIRPVDYYANKAVILHARDALVAISYSGPAHIDGRPTDDWLVNAIYGEDPCPMRDGMRGQRFGPAPPVWTLAQYLECATEELTKAKNNGLIEGVLNFNYVGYRVHRKVPVSLPCLGYMTWRPGAKAYGWNISKRYWGWESQRGNTCVMALGHSQAKAEKMLAARLDGQDINNPEYPEDIMTDVIHSIADEDSTVGRDCMAILIRPTVPQARVRYRPYMRDTVPYSMAGQVGLTPGSFSPWVITPSLTTPPSIIIGQGLTLHAGNLVIQFEAPDPGISLASLSTQPRPVWP